MTGDKSARVPFGADRRQLRRLRKITEYFAA